jgi:cytosine/adenosine deaminase-related metal-dependent hydrolase
VTTNPAAMLRLEDGGRGRIRVGRPADLVLLPPAGERDPVSHLLDLHRSDLRMVMIGGRPVVADTDLEPVFAAARTTPRRVGVDGVTKLMDERLAEMLRRSSLKETGLSL